MQTMTVKDFSHNVEVARDFSLNKEVNLLVHMMSPYKLMQTKVARLLSLNTEVFLMVHLMSPHQLLQTVIARDPST